MKTVCPAGEQNPGVIMVVASPSRTTASDQVCLIRGTSLAQMHRSPNAFARYRERTYNVANTLFLRSLMTVADHLPRIPLAFLPTPLHPLPRLSETLRQELRLPASTPAERAVQLLDQTRRPDRPGRWREQDAQAGAAAGGCAGPGLRHPADHRRGAVQPLPADRGRRGVRRAGVPPGARRRAARAAQRQLPPGSFARRDAALDDPREPAEPAARAGG